jgi:uncharacterized protein (DUF362 family)
MGAAAAMPGSFGRVWAESQVAEVPQGPEVIVSVGDPVEATKAAIEALGGMRRFVRPGDRVAIKPNFSFANAPERATGTNPEVVKTMAQLCVEAGAKRVLVLDHTIHNPKICIDRTGIKAALKGMDKVALLPLNQRRFYREVSVPKGKELKKVEIAKAVLDADCMISVPVAKSHSATEVSFSIKGLLGVVWDRSFFHRSVELNQALADLSTVVQSDLIIVDAIRALQTGGPGGPGHIAELNTILASCDPLCADSYAVGLTQWNSGTFTGRQIKHLLAAHEMGLGEIDVGKMRIRKIGRS